MRVLILGGGASGLAAAICAAKAGASVTVLEGSRKAGRKILASGNGRCNLMNAGEPVYFDGRSFANRMLSAHKNELISFFGQIGLALAQEDGGRVYPATGRARDVLDTLLLYAERFGVTLLYEKKAAGISYGTGPDSLPRFSVICESGERFDADRVIVCCGGMAGLNLGHDGDAYSLLTGFGHSLVSPSPALVAIETERKPLEGLNGLRCPARLTLTRKGKIISSASGEVLFSDHGISGVCAMQLGSEVTGTDETVYIDLSPLFFPEDRAYERLSPPYPGLTCNESRVRALLEERKDRLGAADMLTGLLPGPLKNKFSRLSAAQAAKMICAWPLQVKGTRGMENAQVTRGGLETAEFDPDTCESLKQRGLYGCGEILDVDGDCGGFNLQFAFLSGILAGRAAAAE